MNNEFTMDDLADFTKSICHYKTLAISIGQLEVNNEELKILSNELKKLSNDGKYIDGLSYHFWCNANYHIINQLWSNTSCGWEGIGGSAMSYAYSYIIYNKYLKIICVYYSGKLAYIAKDDEKLEKYKNDNFQNLPGMSSCKASLNIIYKSKY